MRLVKYFSLSHFLGLFFFLLPFIYWPTAPIPYEVPRVFFVQRIIELFALGTLLYRKKTTFTKPYIPLFWSIVFYVLVASLSLLWSVDPNKSIWGNVFRADGLQTLWRLAGFALCVSLVWKAEWEPVLKKAIVYGILGVSLWALGETIVFFDRVWHYGVGATFGQPNFLGGYLVVTFPFLLDLCFREVPKSRNLRIALISIPMLALAFTQSWGSLLSATVGSLVFLSLNKLLKFSAKNILLSSISLCCLVYLLFTMQSAGPPQANPESRLRIFTKLTLAALQKPVLGWGWANVDYAFAAVDWPVKFSSDVYLDKAHSSVLETLVTLGLPGIGAYLVMFFFAIKKVLTMASHDNHSAFSKTLATVLIVYIIHTQTNVVGIAEEIIVWLVLGIVLSTHDNHSTRTRLTG